MGRRGQGGGDNNVAGSEVGGEVGRFIEVGGGVGGDTVATGGYTVHIPTFPLSLAAGRTGGMSISHDLDPPHLTSIKWIRIQALSLANLKPGIMMRILNQNIHSRMLDILKLAEFDTGGKITNF